MTSYLQDRQMTCGVSVPIHLPKGGFASLTGLRTGNSKYVLKDAQQSLTEFSVISHALHKRPTHYSALKCAPTRTST